ncbi:RagB/SusD family nutrient uptake outer membrane protein [Aestuariivivens sediminicola]|uniref:RagB/SusD family nutrient uptake outer membrane protein n=1 Tax=Aestuariivivens sediminicola TaxID=2913560 RepID=UPI001F5AC359|nr:RagB/SusD family nutrient uptake outer membrane protein [Aestuariivivens sediminicola]
MKNIFLKSNRLLAVVMVLALIWSCTDLDLIVEDSIVSEDTGGGGFTGVENPDASLGNIYDRFNSIYGTQENIYALAEVSSDEYLVPTRGTDWGDNGIWRQLHLHTWDPGHKFVLDTWNDFNQMAYNCNEIIDSRSNASAQQVAAAKFLRAYAMWVILDNFGKVPFRGVDEGPSVNPTVLSNTEALNHILTDLDEAIPDLPSVGPGGATNRANKAAAYFLKARVLLNAGIYRGGTAPESSDMAGVIAAVDAIEAEGFQLHDGYFEMFDGTANSERIFYCNAGVESKMWKGLHYSQAHSGNAGGGWNGFTTLAAFYDSFEGNPNSNYMNDGQEERRGWVPDASTANATNEGFGVGFLIGQQYSATGTPLVARKNAPLVFTRELPGLVGNSDVTGIRVLKYSPALGGSYYSGLILFRYADAYLMKAEAMMRSGGDATQMVNDLRALRDAQPLSSVSESDMLEERGRELYDEHVRRTDLIRFNKFADTWEFKDSTDDTKRLFPIPTNAILSNPNLEQNPGY